MDECADKAVKSVSDSIVYGTQEYYDTIKSITLELIKRDPGFCVKALFIKFVTTLRVVYDYYCDLFVRFTNINIRFIFQGILPIGLGFLIWKRNNVIPVIKKYIEKYHVGFLFVSVSFLSGMLQPVLANPSILYAYPAIAGCGLLVLYAGYLLCLVREK